MGSWAGKGSVLPAVSISPHHSQFQCSLGQHPEVDFSSQSRIERLSSILITSPQFLMLQTALL